MSKEAFPEMTIELAGRRYVASMEYNGVKAEEKLPLYFGYLETKEEKHKCLVVHKIVIKLLKKVGFEFERKL